MARQNDYFAASLYAVATGGVPLLDSERHRLTASLHAGIGKDLDRFSAFRLFTRPTAYEWEAVSRPDLPGASSMNSSLQLWDHRAALPL